MTIVDKRGLLMKLFCSLALTVRKTQILYQGPKIWNALPRSITDLSNNLSFQKSLKTFLLTI